MFGSLWNNVKSFGSNFYQLGKHQLEKLSGLGKSIGGHLNTAHDFVKSVHGKMTNFNNSAAGQEIRGYLPESVRNHLHSAGQHFSDFKNKMGDGVNWFHDGVKQFTDKIKQLPSIERQHEAQVHLNPARQF